MKCDQKIQALYAWLTVDSKGNEKVIAFRTKQGVLLNLVSQDHESIHAFKSDLDLAQEINGMKFEFARFTRSDEQHEPPKI